MCAAKDTSRAQQVWMLQQQEHGCLLQTPAARVAVREACNQLFSLSFSLVPLVPVAAAATTAAVADHSHRQQLS